MDKLHVFFGTLLLIPAVLLFTNVADVYFNKDYLQNTFIYLDPSITTIIAIFFTVFALGQTLFLAWLSYKNKSFIPTMDEKLTLKAEIPGHFVFLFVLPVYSILFILAFGLVNWGLALILSTIPILFIYMFAYFFRQNIKDGSTPSS